MALNINGYNLSDSSGLVFGASTTKIGTTGRLTSPATPIVFGSRTNFGGAQNQYPWDLNSTLVNVNSCWNGTVFTCPVAGAYFTAWGGICLGGQSTTATSSLSGYGGLVKNGSLYNFFHWNTNDIWDTVNFMSVVSCAAGDSLSWAINVSPSSVGSSSGAYGSNHNMSTIWLVG
jgi:hypothetical protein